MVDSIGGVGVLHGDAHPEIVGPVELGGDPLETACPLGEHLVRVLGVSRMTSKTRLMKSSGTRAWNRSLIEFTNTTLEPDHRFGSDRDLW
jgi:hypothetical protein